MCVDSTVIHGRNAADIDARVPSTTAKPTLILRRSSERDASGPSITGD
jgi:hypothetical protein